MYYLVKYWIGDVDFWRKKILVSPTIQSSFRSTKRFSSRCLFSIYYVCTMKFTIICWLEKPLSSCCHSVALFNLQTLQSTLSPPSLLLYFDLFFPVSIEYLFKGNAGSQISKSVYSPEKRGSVENSWNSKFLVLNVVGWYVYIHNMT